MHHAKRQASYDVGQVRDKGQARYAKLSIEALTQAVEHGWKDVAHMESDPDLAPIRSDPAYRALVERIKAEKKE